MILSHFSFRNSSRNFFFPREEEGAFVSRSSPVWRKPLTIFPNSLTFICSLSTPMMAQLPIFLAALGLSFNFDGFFKRNSQQMPQNLSKSKTHSREAINCLSLFSWLKKISTFYPHISVCASDA